MDELKLAADAMEAGNSKQAQLLLAQLLKREPSNIHAWVSLSDVVDDPEKKRTFLKKALALDPQHEAARASLEALDQPAPEPAVAETILSPDPTVEMPEVEEDSVIASDDNWLEKLDEAHDNTPIEERNTEQLLSVDFQKAVANDKVQVPDIDNAPVIPDAVYEPADNSETTLMLDGEPVEIEHEPLAVVQEPVIAEDEQPELDEAIFEEAEPIIEVASESNGQQPPSDWLLLAMILLAIVLGMVLAVMMSQQLG